MTTPTIQRINPPSLPTIPGFSQVTTVRGGDLVFIAGQVALNASGKLVGPGDFAMQATQTFQNLISALEAVGADSSHLIKITTFMTDLNHVGTYRSIHDQFLDAAHLPASTLVEVSRLARPEFLIEIEAIAVR